MGPRGTRINLGKQTVRIEGRRACLQVLIQSNVPSNIGSVGRRHRVFQPRETQQASLSRKYMEGRRKRIITAHFTKRASVPLSQASPKSHPISIRIEEIYRQRRLFGRRVYTIVVAFFFTPKIWSSTSEP